MSVIGHAVQSLKENRALLKKPKFKETKGLLHDLSNKTELEFKQVSTEELKRVKQEIRSKAKKAQKIEIGIYSIIEIKCSDACVEIKRDFPFNASRACPEVVYFLSTLVVLSFLFWLFL